MRIILCIAPLLAACGAATANDDARTKSEDADAHRTPAVVEVSLGQPMVNGRVNAGDDDCETKSIEGGASVTDYNACCLKAFDL